MLLGQLAQHSRGHHLSEVRKAKLCKRTHKQQQEESRAEQRQERGELNAVVWERGESNLTRVTSWSCESAPVLLLR